jgi:hypothetical protein
MRKNNLKVLIAPAWTALLAVQAAAQTAQGDKPTNYLLGAQATFIEQAMPAFKSPYVGPNSLSPLAQGRLSDTYTVYAGVTLTKGVEAYLNPEMARGAGLGDALGLAGFTNGDVIRNPSLGQDPYLGRYFIRWTVPVGPGTEEVDRGENQIPGKRPTHRLVVTAGKLGTNDLFDTNRYADSTRTQFMNWALINNAAYDYAADTRGYSLGFTTEWIEPTWTVRFGSFAMPTVANGIDLDTHFSRSRGDQAEFEYRNSFIARKPGGALRFLVYRNLADMGDYAEATAEGRSTNTPPNITATRENARAKYGLGLNFEQPLSDDGDTGVFARLGWDDGRTESFAYTEADDHLSLGAQISGKRWKLAQDHLGIAAVSDGLSGPHRDYLEAGGVGFILGDGRLSYARENILETYYQRQFSKTVSVALDYQGILNPGYNHDRGPVSVLSARLHLEF